MQKVALIRRTKPLVAPELAAGGASLGSRYYPTRTELRILQERAGEISAIVPAGAALVEFGAGATTKVRLLLNGCAVGAYVPVDISGDFLTAQAEALGQDFPDLDVYPVAADFTEPCSPGLPGTARYP